MLFRSKYFFKNKEKIACLVCGFDGKITSYSKAVQSLQSAGYSVIVYEYDNHVFSAGNASILPRLIDEIAEDFSKAAANYSEALATGVSLGAYIAFNIQRRNPKITRGIYGTAGISVAHAIFTAKVFARFRKKFEINGFTEQSLRQKWHTIEILDDLKLDDSKSLLIVMGRIDRIVRYKTASKMMDTWNTHGIKVKYFSKKTLGHTMTIRWYKNNLHKMLSMDSAVREDS